MTRAVDLSVDLFGKTLRNPLILGSGTLVERPEQIAPYVNGGAALVVPRTTRAIMKRTHHPVPHLWQEGRRADPNFFNCEWTGADIAFWRPTLASHIESGDVVMSVSGRDIDDCVAVCRELDEYGRWPYIEVNVSCAHSNFAHGAINSDVEHVKRLVGRLTALDIQSPVLLKLGYSAALMDMCLTAQTEGIDGLVLLNTFGPVFHFDIDSYGRPVRTSGLSGSMSGLSGAPLFPIALDAVAHACRETNVPIVACGGVSNAREVVQMMMAGARAVQVYSAAHSFGSKGPRVFGRILKDMEKQLTSFGVTKLSDVIGSANHILETDTNMSTQVPEVLDDACIACGFCVDICLPDAITEVQVDHAGSAKTSVRIDQDACVGCGHCIPVCPTNVRALQWAS